MAPQLLQNSIASLLRSLYGSSFPPNLWYLAILKELTRKYVIVGVIIELWRKGAQPYPRPGHFTCLGMRSRSHCTQRTACLQHQSSSTLPGTQRARGPPSSSGELKLKIRAKMSKSLHHGFERRPQLSILNQEVPHRAQIYSTVEPLLVTLSPSWGHLSISTWTNTLTKNNRPG